MLSMEATGRDGGHEQTGCSASSISRSSSGTFSTGSHQSSLTVEATMHFDLLELELEILGLSSAMPLALQTLGEVEEKHKNMKNVKSLVQESLSALSANASCIGDMSFLERWLRELGVGWVLRVADGTSLGQEQLELIPKANSWVRALPAITETTLRMASLFPDCGSVGSPSIHDCHEEHENKASTPPDRLQFTQFIQKAMSKMIIFVDVMVNEVLFMSGMPAPNVKLSALLHVHFALSNALSELRFHFDYSPPSDEAETIQSEIVGLLSAREDKAREAVWRTLEEIRTHVLEPMEDSSGAQTPQASSDIHKLTRSVVSHVTFLFRNYSAVAPVVSETARLGKYVPQIEHILPFDSLIMEMMTCLEEKLVNILESFSDQGLGFLFLLNNTNFIWEKLTNCIQSFPQIRTQCSSLEANMAALLDKVEGYTKSYLQVSWAPVLSCLFNPTPFCFGKSYSPLSKFESEFWKTYNTQKLWKISNPKLKKSLREAITEKIIPKYTNYIEDNIDVITPRVAPHELAGMLQEIFEG